MLTIEARTIISKILKGDKSHFMFYKKDLLNVLSKINQSNILKFEDLKYMEELLTGLNDIYVEST